MSVGSLNITEVIVFSRLLNKSAAQHENCFGSKVQVADPGGNWDLSMPEISLAFATNVQSYTVNLCIVGFFVARGRSFLDLQRYLGF
jgi:hypothetical protein